MNGAEQEKFQKLKIKQDCIWNCLHHIRRTYKNFIWLFKSEIDNFKLDDYINNNTQARKIVQTDNDFNIIKVWDSAHQAQVIGKFDCSRILKFCKGKIKTAYNYQWFYKEDYENKFGEIVTIKLSER